MDSTDRAGVSVGAVIPHDADRHYRQQHGERLPNLIVETGRFDFGDNDLICVLKQLHSLGCDLAQNANGESRTGKRLTLQNLLWHAQVASDAANLVLKEILQGLDQLEIHLLRQSANVVMSLNGLRRASHRARFDYIRIQGALNQELGFPSATAI